MNQKKQLLNLIIALEEKINLAKTEKERDKQYFANLIERHRSLMIAMLFPAFLVGWQSGKNKNTRSKRFVRQLGKQSLIGVYKLFKNYYKLI